MFDRQKLTSLHQRYRHKYLISGTYMNYLTVIPALANVQKSRMHVLAVVDKPSGSPKMILHLFGVEKSVHCRSFAHIFIRKLYNVFQYVRSFN